MFNVSIRCNNRGRVGNSYMGNNKENSKSISSIMDNMIEVLIKLVLHLRLFVCFF